MLKYSSRFGSAAFAEKNAYLHKSFMEDFKDMEKSLDGLLLLGPNETVFTNRMDQAYLKLEECFMWVGKAIKAKQDIEDLQK